MLRLSNLSPSNKVYFNLQNYLSLQLRVATWSMVARTSVEYPTIFFIHHAFMSCSQKSPSKTSSGRGYYRHSKLACVLPYQNTEMPIFYRVTAVTKLCDTNGTCRVQWKSMLYENIVQLRAQIVMFQNKRPGGVVKGCLICEV